MRNWLRKLIGAASKSDAEMFVHGTNNRLDMIENIDGIKKPGILGEIASPLEKCVIDLENRTVGTDKALNQLGATIGAGIKAVEDKGTIADNAILKRLLFVEMSLGIVPREDGIPTVGDTLRKLGEAHKALDGKCNTNKSLLDKVLAELVEHRMEVKAVKEGVERIALVSEASMESARMDPEIRACLEQSSKSPNKKSPAKRKNAR